MQPSLHIENLNLFRQNELLLKLNEHINGGEILTIMGPSGCGKSTLLNWITGSLTTNFTATGNIILNNQNLTDVPAHMRKIGVLYQDALLFSHLSVAGNIAFAMPKGNKKQRLEKIETALENLGLKGLADRHPDSLSGGQQSRVALLRLLLNEPKAILLDEPFSKLDSALRETTRHLVFEKIRDYKLPAILVTHDHNDAIAAGGKIINLS